MRLIKHLNESSGKTPMLLIAQLLFDKAMPYMKDMAKTGRATDMLSGRSYNRDWFINKIRKNRTPKDTPEDMSDDFDYLFKRRFGWQPRAESIFVTSQFTTAATYGEVYMIFPVGKYKFLWNRRVPDLWTSVEDTAIHNYYMGENGIPGREMDEKYSEIEDALGKQWDDENTHPDNKNYDEETDYYDDMVDWDEARQTHIDDNIRDVYDEWKEQRLQDVEAEAREDMKDIVYGYTNKNLGAALNTKVEIMLSSKEYIAVNYRTYTTALESFVYNHNWRRRPTQEDVELWAGKFKIPNKNNFLWKE